METSDPTAIFIIEDDPMTCDFMQDMLTLWGFHTVVLRSMLEVSRHLQKSSVKPSLLLVDLNLDGEGNGLDVIRLIRAHVGQQDVEALIVTGDINFRTQACALAHVQILHKPVRPDALKKMIQASLSPTAIYKESS